MAKAALEAKQIWTERVLFYCNIVFCKCRLLVVAGFYKSGTEVLDNFSMFLAQDAEYVQKILEY